jgi:hypothetical protein
MLAGYAGSLTMFSAGWLSMLVEWICWLPFWLAILDILAMMNTLTGWL